MAHELASIGIKLSYKNGEEYVQLQGLTNVPEIGGTPELLECTDLDSTVKKYIQGVKDFGELEFEFNYHAGEDGNYRILRGLEEAKETVDFKLEYPDKTAFEFSGEVANRLGSQGVNAVMTFTLSVALNSEVKVTFAD